MRTNRTSLALAILAGCAATFALLPYGWAHIASGGIAATLAALHALPMLANPAMKLAAKMLSKAR